MKEIVKAIYDGLENMGFDVSSLEFTTNGPDEYYGIKEEYISSIKLEAHSTQNHRTKNIEKTK